MQYAVLGPLRALRDGHDVTPRGQRGRDVLAVLILRRGRSVDAQVLLDQVWQSEAAGLDVAVVHTAVARLRSTLGAEAIETTSTGYRLAESRIDHVDFEEHLSRARTGSPTTGTEELRAALALWRAEPAYADVSEAITATEQPRLAELRHDAQESLVAGLLDRGDPASDREALALADDLVARDPLRERAHELVMLAAYRCGRQAQALAAHERLRRILRDELGVDPSPTTERLHARILAQDPALSASRPAPASGTVGAPAAPTTPLVGREQELEALAGLSSRRVVTLLGPGGVGKSRVLAELYWQRRAEGAVAYLDLTNADEIAEALGQALGLGLGVTDPLASLTQALADRTVTIFLDEAEWAGDALAPIVSHLVRGCPGVSIVVASRRPLDILGESRLVLEPLRCPEPDDGLPATREAPAVRLLVERLTDQASGTLSDHDLLALGEVSRRVDGLPLALELVAGYAGSRSVMDLLELLDTSLDLTTTEHDRPPRHRTLRDTILWSAERLPDSQRLALRRLGVFVGDFDLSAAAAVVGPGLGEVGAVCRALAREALIQVRRTPDGALSWRLLRTVRDLALEGLAEGPDLNATRTRHREWHAGRWRGAPRSDSLIADLRHHHEDYLMALRNALEARDAGSVAALIVTLCRWWIFTDAVGPGLRWTERVLESGLLTQREHARLLVLRANLLIHQYPADARAAAAAAVPLLDAEQDHTWLVGAHLTQALERHSSADLGTALEQAVLAVQAARRSTPERLADSLSVLAIVQAAHGDRLATGRSVAEAWALAVASGSTAALASVANNLSLALVEIEQADEALILLAEVEARLGVLELPLFLRHTSAWVSVVTGDPEGALARFAEVVGASPDSVADLRAAESYAGAGCALAALGRQEEAAILVNGARELAGRLGMVLPRWMSARIDQAGGVAADSGPWSTVELGTRLAAMVVSTAGSSERSSNSSSS